jgi:hypothetical protein
MLFTTQSNNADIYLEDLKGSTFNVIVATRQNGSILSAKEEFSVASNDELKNQLKSIIKSAEIVIKDRGVRKISNLEFYYLDFTAKITGRPLVHFQTYYYYSSLNLIVLNVSCIEENFKEKNEEFKKILDGIEMSDPLFMRFNYFDLKKEFDKVIELHSKKKLEQVVQNVKEKEVPTDKSKLNETWDENIYRNSKYKFRVSFPKGWEYDNGTSKITLARALNREKAAVLLVGVKHIPKADEHTATDSEYKKQFIELLSLQNVVPENIEVTDGYLNNFPAKFITLKSLEKIGTLEIMYISKQILCFIEDKQYGLTLNIPADEYDSEIVKLWNRYIGSFKFEFAY